MRKPCLLRAAKIMSKHKKTHFLLMPLAVSDNPYFIFFLILKKAKKMASCIVSWIG
jgi:hypothetical protein